MASCVKHSNFPQGKSGHWRSELSSSQPSEKATRDQVSSGLPLQKKWLPGIHVIPRPANAKWRIHSFGLAMESPEWSVVEEVNGARPSKVQGLRPRPFQSSCNAQSAGRGFPLLDHLKLPLPRSFHQSTHGVHLPRDQRGHCQN